MTIAGAFTLLVGIAYLVAGCFLLYAGTSLTALREGDPMGGFAFLLWLVGAFVVVVGTAFLLQGVLGVLAGWAVVRRKGWGRVLSFVLAVPACLWGVACLAQYEQGTAYAVAGVAQLAYSILTIVVLACNGAEFSGPKAVGWEPT